MRDLKFQTIKSTLVHCFTQKPCTHKKKNEQKPTTADMHIAFVPDIRFCSLYANSMLYIVVLVFALSPKNTANSVSYVYCVVI